MSDTPARETESLPAPLARRLDQACARHEAAW
jgi:hypothetical protein